MNRSVFCFIIVVADGFVAEFSAVLTAKAFTEACDNDRVVLIREAPVFFRFDLPGMNDAFIFPAFIAVYEQRIF